MKQLNKYVFLALTAANIIGFAPTLCSSETKFNFPASEQPKELRETTLSGSILVVLGGLVAGKSAQFIYENWESMKKDPEFYEQLAAFVGLIGLGTLTAGFGLDLLLNEAT